jgi:fructuronate reductase
VQRPTDDRSARRVGMAHIGVGAFHRCHQEEYTDDLLGQRFDRWGVVGINIRAPRLSGGLGGQQGLYTRLLRENDRVEARVIGSMVGVVDSQETPEPALEVLASPQIDVVTMTVTEKGYCHTPATGELAVDAPDIVHDFAHPEAPRSLPGLIARALELRMQSHGRPLTLMSCDNIPSNGVILGNVVRAVAERHSRTLADWIDRNAAFPSSMVDRIAPATAQADTDTVEQRFGYRDNAVVVGEPFRQWVIEQRFAGRIPQWDLVGAAFVDNVEPFEHLKMRVLNGAQTTLCYLGVFAGYECTCDDMTDPLLVNFVRRMLMEETVPTLQPVAGIVPQVYVEQSLKRLRNKAIRHRNHQIATDGSQKIVQRLLNPIRERLSRGQGVALLSVPVAAWMVYLIRASTRFGRSWVADDPYAGPVAAIADRIGNDPTALAASILAIDHLFDPRLAANAEFGAAVARGIEGFLAADPLAYLRKVDTGMPQPQLNGSRQTG